MSDNPPITDSGTEESLPAQPKTRSSRRKKLRFSLLRGKPMVLEHLHVDNALDMLGTKRFADEWGILPDFDRLPFQYVKQGKIKGFYSYKLALKKGRLRIIKTPLAASSVSARQRLLAVDRIYKSVRNELKEALERGDFIARQIASGYDIVDIKSPGLWADQAISIFYTGFFKRENAKGPDTRVRVLIDKPSFEAWLSGNPIAKTAQRPGLTTVDPRGGSNSPATPGAPAASSQTQTQTQASTRAKSKMGRPPVWDWEEAAYEMARRQFRQKDPPPNMSQMAKHIQKWFAQKYQGEPAASTVDTHVARFYEALGVKPEP